MMLYLQNLWTLFVDMSFFMVIGLVFTGLLYAFVKKDVILKHIGKNTFGSVVKASIFGVPLPLCSCGVVPTAIYLGKSGASKGAVVSFLTSTPQTGIDSLIATYGMLGPLFAIYRAVAAFISGIISGITTNIFCKNNKIKFDNSKASCSCASHNCKQSKCSGCEHSHPEKSPDHSCCCHDNNIKNNDIHISFFKKLQIAFSYAFGEFLDEIAFHFIIGLLLAALINTLLPANLFSAFQNTILTMLLMIIIGIPMYICSTASIPIALSLILKGISPGSAFVFLFAGPVTNIASLAVLVKTLGKKVTAIYLSSVAVCAIVFGLILDYIIDISNYAILQNSSIQSNESGTPIYMIVVAILFSILIFKSLTKNLVRKIKS